MLPNAEYERNIQQMYSTVFAKQHRIYAKRGHKQDFFITRVKPM